MEPTKVKELAQSSASILHESETVFDKVQPFELIFEQIRVTADVQEEVVIDGKTQSVPALKTILKECSGKFSPNTFTAILGPSGCGKTTMLNLISGRLLSENLKLYGLLRVNGEETCDLSNYKSKIGYVMQDDFMLATFTPYESFKFVTDLRLSYLPEEERIRLVDHIIASLGLEKCRDTLVGDVRIRGLSGGQKKRTSIGLELLINPSIIFLDQPTTGLDSTTSLNLIRFLNKLAHNGRTIVSTIHQPSSQIFQEFNRIMLMVDGNIVYDGEAKNSMSYFAKIGLSVPTNTNPTDYYMKLMNKEGIMLKYIEKDIPFTEEQIEKEFKERLVHLVSSHQNYKVAITNEVITALEETHETQEASWCTQFGTIFKRNVINEFRQPLDVAIKVVQSIFFGVMTIILYYQKGTTDFEILQNNQGVIFFFVMTISMSFIFANVNLFNFERPVFIRERLSNTYSVTAYYAGRTAAVIPVEIFTCFLYLSIGYFTSNLNNSAGAFFETLLALELCGFMSASFGLLLSTIFADASIVMALVPTLIIPFMLAAGFFTALSNISPVYYPFEYLSSFRYGFEGLVNAQYRNGVQLISHYAYPLSDGSFQFQTPQWLTLTLMAIIGVLIRLISLAMLFKISNPKTMPLEKPVLAAKQDRVQP